MFLTHVGLRTVDNIALAYFANTQNLNDAVRDLCSAHFKANHINISQPKRGDAPARKIADAQPYFNATSRHTLCWLLNREGAHDRHRRGADQTATRKFSRHPRKSSAPIIPPGYQPSQTVLKTLHLLHYGNTTLCQPYTGGVQ